MHLSQGHEALMARLRARSTPQWSVGGSRLYVIVVCAVNEAVNNNAVMICFMSSRSTKSSSGTVLAVELACERHDGQNNVGIPVISQPLATRYSRRGGRRVNTQYFRRAAIKRDITRPRAGSRAYHLHPVRKAILRIASGCGIQP